MSEPIQNHANSLADGAMPSLTQSRHQLILANAPSTPQISLPSRSGHITLRCLRFSDPTYLLRSSICTSATASVELCSPRGEVPWSFAAVNRRARVSSLAKTHTVSALSAWGFRMHVTRLTGPRNARFARISVL